MGSEQSSQQGGNVSEKRKGTRIGQLRRGKSVPERQPEPDPEVPRPGSCSPGLSVCSDSELPYISYTVNRPIGDSPKHPGKQGHLLRGRTMGGSSSPSRKNPGRKTQQVWKAAQESVVVVKPALREDTTDKDPDILKLQKIPLFLPVMRGTLNLPSPRDPEVLERLDPAALYRLCVRSQRHIHQSAVSIATEQDALGTRIKQMDSELSDVVTAHLERQKQLGKQVECLSKVTELTSQIAKCHLVLNKTLESIEGLNNLLPPEERLEPFVWTTG